jgi:hypothetical protein
LPEECEPDFWEQAGISPESTVPTNMESEETLTI